jgi:hypothetical protein
MCDTVVPCTRTPLPVRYLTSLPHSCRQGACPFADDCVYAHGEAELRKHPMAIAREQQQASHRARMGMVRAGVATALLTCIKLA